MRRRGSNLKDDARAAAEELAARVANRLGDVERGVRVLGPLMEEAGDGLANSTRRSSPNVAGGD
jgi:hypothetical protein